MNARMWKRLRRRNRLQTALSLVAAVGLAALLSYLLLGPAWAVALAGGTALGLVLLPSVSPAWIVRAYGGRPLTVSAAPELHAVVADLAKRAELERAPSLYFVPSLTPNAFAVGRAPDAAIALTTGLLRTMTVAELTGILAHEIAHIRNDDVRVMMIAGAVSRFTESLAQVGAVMLLLGLALQVTVDVPTSWGVVATLLVAPFVTGLLELALSRARERQADLEAARLTGQPGALASALRKLAGLDTAPLRRIFHRDRVYGPPWARSHPDTRERIRTLLSLTPAISPRFPRLSHSEIAHLLGQMQRGRRARFRGPWVAL